MRPEYLWSRRTAFELGADRFGARVEFTVGEPHIDGRDPERRHELAEADERADVDVPPDLDGHEVMGERAKQHVGEVPDQEQGAHRKYEAAQPMSQLLELRAGLYGQIFLTADGGFA